MKRSPQMFVVLLALWLLPFSVWAQDDVNSDDGINIMEAESLALTVYPDAAVLLTERDFEDGVQAWDVKLDNGMAVYISVQTGMILEIEPWQGGWDAGVPFVFVPPNVIEADMMDVGEDGVDFREAQAIALAYYPDAEVIEVDLEPENGIEAWDVVLDNGMAVYINAMTGDVLAFEAWNDMDADEAWRSDGRDGESGPPPWAGFPGGRRAWEAQQRDLMAATSPSPQTGGSISFEEARTIALSQYPNATLIEGELVPPEDEDWNVPAWDMELSNGMSVYVNAINGAILEIEPW